MVLRTRPAAAFALLLTAIVPARALSQTPPVARPGFILLTAVVGQDGTRYQYEISQERADKLLPWDQVAVPDPPLPLSTARKVAEVWLLSRSSDVKTFEMASLFFGRAVPGTAPAGSCRVTACWYYRISFDPMVGSRRLNGGSDFTVVVLMDGSIVEPRAESRAPQGAGAAPPPAARPSGPGPVRVGGPIRPPTQTKRANPVYPPDAQSARIQGVVILEATIGPDGKVQSTKVLRSIPELDQAAVDAVKQWEYTPTLLNGAPVAVIMTVTVNFALQ